MATVYLCKAKDKCQTSSYARKIVSLVASKKLKTTILQSDFALNKNGKPYLKDYPNFYFNISHSQNYVAVAFAESPVGVDIEVFRQPDLRVAKRFFSAEEQELLTNENTAQRFFEIWTKKEAFIKMKGLTLSSIKDTESENIFTHKNKIFAVSICVEAPEKVEIKEISSLEKILDI